MKKLIFAGLFLVIATGISAQGGFALTEGVPAMLYSLPKTELRFEIEVEKRTEKPGVFFTQAQRFLGTSRVITEEKTVYTLKSIRLTTHTVPDPARRFAFTPVAGSPLNRLVVDELGILCGVNVQPELRSAKIHVPAQKAASHEIPVTNYAGLLPLTREFFVQGTAARLAEGAASQIYDIRASRLNLLVGDMDKMPSEESLKIMLHGLNEKEKELTELFIGSVNIETEKHIITIVPEKDKMRDVLFRLSSIRGVVAKDDLGGEPFHITFLPERIPVLPVETDSRNRRVTPEAPGLFTVLPAHTQIRVTDGVNTLLEEMHFIPQLGELTSLPESVLKTTNIKLYIHRETGRLLRMDF